MVITLFLASLRFVENRFAREPLGSILLIWSSLSFLNDVWFRKFSFIAIKRKTVVRVIT